MAETPVATMPKELQKENDRSQKVRTVEARAGEDDINSVFGSI